MKYLITSGFLLLSAFAANTFAAEADDEWYAGISGDIAFPRNTDVTGPTKGKVRYDFSSGGDIAIGYRPQLLNNSIGDMRLELEGGYHAFGLKDVSIGGLTNRNPKGDLGVATLMGNVFYDLHTGTGFTPYIGAGLGEAHISFNKNNGLGMTDGSDDRLGYQFMTGISYTPESMPKTEWSVGYRYLGTTSPQFSAATGNEKFDSLSSSNIEAGFKYHF